MISSLVFLRWWMYTGKGRVKNKERKTSFMFTLRRYTPAEVMAVGDNLNDIDMLEFAGTAVLMGNAATDVRDRLPAVHLTGTNDEDGLADAVRRFVLD